MADIIQRLRKAVEIARSDSLTVESDRCVGKAEEDAIEAERVELEAVRDEVTALLRAVADAWNVEGREPVHHRRQQTRLRLEWPVLAAAVENIATSLADELGESDG
ncbi:hypothetical protein [Microbacterium sp. KNMS]